MLELNLAVEDIISSATPVSHIAFSSSSSHQTSLADYNITEGNMSALVDYSAELWYRHSNTWTVLFSAVYFLVFVLGLVGNVLVVMVVVRSPRMRTVTNIFIVNLAFADILVLVFCVPATLLSNIFVRVFYYIDIDLYLCAAWILGSVMCKMVSYLQGVSVSASINTLVAISADRFLAICYPLKCQMTTSWARRIIIFIWAFSILVYIPWAYFFHLESVLMGDQDVYFCVEKWPMAFPYEKPYYLFFNLCLCYLLPLAVISFCYVGIWLKVWRRSIPGETRGTNADAVMQRSKLKVVKMMIIVVALFFLSWLPLYILFTMVKMGVAIQEDSEHVMAIAVPLAQWLGAFNSCINPLLYNFCNKKFRKGFEAVLRSRSCCGTLRYETARKETKSTVLRSTFKSRETQSEYMHSSQV